MERAQPYISKAVSKVKTLPLFTIAISVVIIFFYLLSFISGIVEAFWLRPSSLWNLELSRLTTYPLVHFSFLHIALNLTAFIPLCAKFEKQYGTLRSIAMFLGPFESFPGILYSIIDGGILRMDTAIAGSSGYVFTLMTIESMILGRGRSGAIIFAGRQIPYWSLPLILLALSTIFLPGSSFLGHCCAIAVGALFGTGRVDFLLLPQEIVKWLERKGHMVVALLPGYVTAEEAGSNNPELPTTESIGGFSGPGYRVGSTGMSPDGSHTPFLASPNLAVPKRSPSPVPSNSLAGAARPGNNRRVSTNLRQTT